MQRVDISGNMAMIKTVNAQECVENIIFEIVCICKPTKNQNKDLTIKQKPRERN